MLETWTYPSKSEPGVTRTVTADIEQGIWTCDCPFIPSRRGGSRVCSHIFDAQADVASGKRKVAISPTSLDQDFAPFVAPGCVTPVEDWSAPEPEEDPLAAGKSKLQALVEATLTEPVLVKPDANGDARVTIRDGDLVHLEAEVDLDTGAVGPTKVTVFPEGQSGYQQKLAQEQREAEEKAQEEALAQEPAHTVTDVHTAILAVYGEVEYVQKKGKVNGQGGPSYSFAGEADIISALRPHLVRHGLTASVTKLRNRKVREFETKSQTLWANTTLEARVTFRHAPSGTKTHVWTAGEGSDSGDKGTPKALTGALKYALRQTFLLETGDDPDKQSSAEQERQGPTAQQRRDKVMDRRQERPAREGDTPQWWDWFINQRNKLGLTAVELEPILQKRATPFNVQAYLDSLEPVPTTREDIGDALLDLLARAAEWKAKKEAQNQR